MQFGRKSEKLDREIGQLELRLEDLQADDGAAEMAAAPAVPRAQRESIGRKPLPEHLEREERVHMPAGDGCPDCGGRLKPLGEDVAEQIEYVRAHFRVICSCFNLTEYVSPCCNCEKQLCMTHLHRGL